MRQTFWRLVTRRRRRFRNVSRTSCRDKRSMACRLEFDLQTRKSSVCDWTSGPAQRPALLTYLLCWACFMLSQARGSAALY